MSEEPEGVSAIRGNGYDPAILEKFVDRIENLIDNIASERGTSMKRCKVIHNDIKEVYKEARAAGVTKKSLAQVIVTRELRRKLDDAQNTLEGEDQESYEQMLSALGMLSDLPLGQAAAREHPGKPDESAPLPAAAEEI